MMEAYSEIVLDIQPGSYSAAVAPDPLSAALPFHLEYAGQFDCGPNYITHRCGMDNYLMIYTFGGCGQIDVGAGRHMLLPGSVMLIDCTKPHDYGTAHRGSWQFYFAHFNGRMEAYAPLLLGAGPVIFPPEPQRFRNDFVALLEEMRRGEPTACLACSDLLSRLVTQLALAGYTHQPEMNLRRYLPALHELIAYLHSHYAQPLSLEDMADRLHLSKFHFTRLFRAYARTTPYAYLNDLRVNAACERLMITNAPVQEIAEAVGLISSTRLIRLFKARYGITPARFREQMR